MFKYILFIISIEAVASMHSTKAIEGYSVGYIATCPGMENEPKITEKSLKDLSIVTIARDNFLMASTNKTFYNYYQMRQLARATDLKKKTLVYMVGYLDSPKAFMSSALMGYLHFHLGYNVWLLDFYRINIQMFSFTLRFLRPTCKRFAEMLAKLTSFGLNPKKIHLLGLSNGGQGVSLIAKHYQKLTGVKVSRITSLDPSGVCFRNLSADKRLDRSDADFVDVIHTNIDGYGTPIPSGHVDFYLNGGEYQPSQAYTLFNCGSTCSHISSFNYWVGAMFDPDGFIGIQCDSVQQARNRECFDRVPRVTNVMGFKVNKSREGIFFLATAPGFPYSLGEKGINKEYLKNHNVLKFFTDLNVF